MTDSMRASADSGAIRIPARGASRYHRIDGWRGYSVPALAVAGASDTGTWDDSPCPSPQVKAELARLSKHLRENGVPVRTRYGTSSNVFCGKRWLVVRNREDWPRAAQLALDWMEEHRADTRFIHSAEQEQLGVRAAA